ncbi:MAG: VTT domain-containing protein [candidate division WOR-3 bacterium]
MNSGILAPLIMIGLQVIQIIMAPFPGQLTAFVSGYIFGAFLGTVLSMIGVVIGALTAFFLARLTGRRLLKYFLHTSTLQRFDTYTLKQGPFLLFLLLLIPNPIGDGVYYFAGLTNFPWLPYIILVIVTRLPSNIISNTIGAKATNFNLCHWFALGLTILILIILYYFNRKRIEKFLVRLASGKNSKREF